MASELDVAWDASGAVVGMAPDESRSDAGSTRSTTASGKSKAKAARTRSKRADVNKLTSSFTSWGVTPDPTSGFQITVLVSGR